MGSMSLATDTQQHLPKGKSNTRRGRNFSELIWSDRTVTEKKERNPHEPKKLVAQV
jgi:hypothetical protein